MKDRGEYTLTRDAVVNLTAEFLTTRGVPENADAMLDLEVRWVDGSARYRPADVIAWCRERQPPAIRRALARSAMVDEIMASMIEPESYGEGVHDWTPTIESTTSEVVYDVLEQIIKAGDDAAGDES